MVRRQVLGFMLIKWVKHEEWRYRKYHPSSVIQTFVFSSWKSGCIRYILLQVYNKIKYHMTKDTNGKLTNSKLYITNESYEVSPFPEVDRKAQINRHTQRHKKHKSEKT